jgi:hypothetical protein
LITINPSARTRAGKTTRSAEASRRRDRIFTSAIWRGIEERVSDAGEKFVKKL